MSKKKKKQQKETTIENFYDLKVDQVDELVSILKGEDTATDKEVVTDIKEITGEEVKGRSQKAKNFDPYKRDKLAMLPTWLKAIFIKWWFSGCVCYFIMWGLGELLTSELDFVRAIILGFIMGMVVDLLVNPSFRYLDSDRHEFNNYMMFPFPFKQFWTFFANIIYYIAVVWIVYYVYMGLNLLIDLSNPEGFIGVEPLLFGTICVIVDMAFIGIKDAIVYLVKKNRKKRSEEVSTDV